MHPWHDIELPDSLATFPVVIEIPQGEKNKYELDKKTGLLRLDRVLFSAVHYPANYGFIPRTLSPDGDALDVLVLGQIPVVPLTLLDARAVGAFTMEDEHGGDDKIISVHVHDPQYSSYQELDELPKQVVSEIVRFFEMYKATEEKQVCVGKPAGRERALQIIREAIERYRIQFAAAGVI